MIVIYDDIAKAGYCASGAKTWFAAHGLDFRDFLKNGLDASVFEATGDAMALRVVETAKRRVESGNG